MVAPSWTTAPVPGRDAAPAAEVAKPPRESPAPVLADVPPPEDPAPEGVVDPNGLAAVVDRLSAESLRAGRVAIGILSSLLRGDEKVDAMVQGTYQRDAAVAVLTDKRLLLVNEHEWVPDVRAIEITPDLLVQGWQDDRTASLIFIVDGRSVTISLISDRPLAQDMAHRIRARVAEANPR
jgi:hypothetical protein